MIRIMTKPQNNPATSAGALSNKRVRLYGLATFGA
jgi:hypothetical protein